MADFSKPWHPRRTALPLLACVASGAAMAQTEPPASDAAARTEAGRSESVVLETVIVTTQKRRQSLQDVPVSVTAFTEAQLERAGARTVADLTALTPGLNGTAVATTTPRITVRGVSTEDFGVGSDPALGVYVDDVYLGRGVSSLSDLFDVGRVEVVKGPQGTLFGRNTTAGAISVLTNTPTRRFEASGAVTVGSKGLRDVKAMLNLPLDNVLGLRLAASHRETDGYVRNTLGGPLPTSQTHAVRLSLGGRQGDHEGTLSLEHRTTQDRPGPYFNVLALPGDRFGAVSSDLGDRAHDDIRSTRVTLRLSTQWQGLRLSSITSASRFTNHYLEDTDASPAALLHFGTSGGQNSVSQEFRINGGSEAFNWFLGASAYRDRARSTQFSRFDEEAWCQALFTATCNDAVGAPGAALVEERSIASGRYRGAAVYGDATYQLTPTLEATFGLRIGSDRKTFRVRLPANDNLLGPLTITPPDPAALAGLGSVAADGTLAQTETFSSTTPRAVLSWAWAERQRVYVSYTRGYKAGGFNQIQPGPAFSPEKIASFEVGAKGRSRSGDWRYEISAFHYDYDDLQVLLNQGGSVITKNAATARGRGLEGSVTLNVANGLSVVAGAALLDARYRRFCTVVADPCPADADYSGNRLVRSPRWTFNLAADYRAGHSDGEEWFLHGELTARGHQFFRAANGSLDRQGGHAVLNLSAGSTAWSGRGELSLWVKNVLDKRFLNDAQLVVPDLIAYTQRAAPRTFGLRLAYNFD